MKNDINWTEIQRFYNDGNSVSETSKNFKISERQLYKASKLGIIIFRNKSDSTRISYVKFPRKHTTETKKKISDHRKKYLLENPDKVPYKLNHSSKESYPEKYFTELFEMENIIVEKKYQIGLYELDFCIVDKKIDIEIDGSQHYYDEKIVESDKRRTKFLEENGWDVIRVNWSNYKKMTPVEKFGYIKNMKNYINKLINEKPTIHIKSEIKTKINKPETKKDYRCFYCDTKCSHGNNRCEPCYREQSRKVERPTLEQLNLDIENLGYSATGRKYGVSDNTIRKWIKSYEK